MVQHRLKLHATLIIGTSGGVATLAPESGPFQYTVTVQNNGGTTPGLYDVQCVTLFAQLPCETPSLSSFQLGGGGATQIITVPYHTRGLGAFQQKLLITLDAVPIKKDSVIVGYILVNGIPIVQHQNPPDGADLGTADTLRVTYSHPNSLIDTANVRVFLNGSLRTGAVLKKTLSGYTARVDSLNLLGGSYRWTTYACAVNGRCDSVTTNFKMIAPSNYALDDSLPPTSDPLGSGTLLGPLPLPPTNLRGCSQDPGYPEISFTRPLTYVTQSAPNGRVFVAVIDTSALTLMASTQSLAWLPNRSQTCGLLSYLDRSQFDWTYFAPNPPNDPRWASYPYGDLAVNYQRPSEWELQQEPTELAFRGPNAARALRSAWATWSGKGESTGGARSGPHGPAPSVPWEGALAGSAAMLLPDPGPIDSTSYHLELNGVVIVDHSQPVAGPAGAGIAITRMTRLFQDISIPVTHPNLNTTAQGGWNEMVATISDTAHRPTSIRTRFIYDRSFQAGPVQPLAIASLRDFTHLDQGACAAFGAFQCDGVMLTATIPGFVTRDRDRALHLVYRSGSQRAPTLIPVKLTVQKTQKAPDSLWVTPALNGVLDTTRRNRYAGAVGAVTGPNASRINESRDEERIVGTEVSAPTTGNAAIRKVTHWVRSWFVPGVGTTFRDDSVSQDVVQLYLSDTLATRFGQGWQLAELGRLVLGQKFKGDTAAIWLAGDGSYTIFRKPAAVWLTSPGENSRLVTLTTADAGAIYVLYPDNGASIGFRADGWQVWTRDLVGNATTYFYKTTTSTRMDSIADPAGKKIVFRYFTGGKRIGNPQSVYLRFSTTASDTATVAHFGYDTVTNTSATRLKSVAIRRSATATDTVVTRFSYFGGAAPGAFVDSVIDPRDSTGKRVVTRFAYDQTLWTPDFVTRPLGGVASIRLPWRRAVPRIGYGRAGNALERTVQYVQYVGTSVPFAGTPTDYTVDAFGGPTMVRHLSTDPSLAGSQGDDVRHMVTDTAGRPVRVVRNRYTPSKADSVVYHYDALGRVDSLIRTTLEYQATGQTRALDTLSFIYDSITLVGGKTWCSRLLLSKDPMARPTSMGYGASGVGRCLPTRVVGIAADTTFFTYGPLTAGNAAGVRPLTTRDPNGLKDSVAYHTGTWNSEYFVRMKDQAITRAFYDRFGRPDSVVDPVGVRTWFVRDRLGRVTHQKTGTGSLAPVARTVYDKGGLVTQVNVYSATDNLSAITTVPGTAQTTRSYFNQLGWVDSTVTPGSRVPSSGYQARRQAYAAFDGFGNPRWERSGNGSYVSRIYDWQGRVSSMELSQVRPGYTTDNERFADATTTSWWNSLQLPTGKVQSAGQKHTFKYDAKSQLIADSSYDAFLGFSDPISGPTPSSSRKYGYSRAGALIADTLDFGRNGATVIRRLEYNLLGQRTLATDTVLGSGLGSSPERTGQIVYWYNTTTSRLDSVVGYAGGERYAKVRWVYDRGGRDTLRAVLIVSPQTPSNAEVVTRTAYDSVGRVGGLSTANTPGWNAGHVWYALSSPSYTKVDELMGFTSVEPGAKSGSHTYTYTTDGTRRLLSAPEGQMSSTWTYDVFGNRLTEGYGSSVGDDPCKGSRSLAYGTDNRLKWRTGIVGQTTCPMSRYWIDQNGNRLGESDTTQTNPPGVPPLLGLVGLSSYTAGNELYFSVTPAGVGQWDFNWHWYDAQGRRVASQMGGSNQLYPIPHPDSLGLNRTFYVYDGNDVAMVLLRSGGTWSVDSRLLVGSIDQPLTGRFQMSGSYKNLALVGDRNGTMIEAVEGDGTPEGNAAYVRRDAYGALVGLVSTGQQPQPLAGAGYAGAGTPNSRGGFVYLRNRWYDPITGRFLTQDPIGLAGGVNLYAYAGNNPIAFRDPFGLCEPWPACATDYWDDAGVSGHQEGGVLGAAKAAGAAVMGALIEGFGINQADQGMGMIADGKTGPGLLLVGLAVGENLPGGKAARGIVKAGEKLNVAVRGTKEYAKDLFRSQTGDRGLKVMRDRQTGRITGARTADGSAIYRPKGGKDGVIANVEVINDQGTRVDVHVRE